MKRLLSFLPLIFLSILGTTLSCQPSPPGTIKLGATFPLTGDNASYGEHLRNAIEIRVQEVNTAGGIAGRPVEFIYLDDANDPKQAVTNLQRLASVDKVPAVIGSAGSNCSLAMAPIANSTGTVMVSPTSSAEALSTAGPMVYRTCPSDAYQGKVISQWIREEGYSKVGILYVNNSWGVGMKDKFVKEFTAAGGEVVDIESGDELAPDFRTQLTKLASSGAQALFLPTYSKQGGRVVKQARQLGIDLPLYGADPWDVPEFKEAAGTAANGVFYTVFDQYKGPEYQAFAKKYRDLYHEDPDFIAASGYDAALVLTDAISNLLKAGSAISGKGISQQLHSLRLTGATGPLDFDENGDVVGKAFTRKTIINGTISAYSGRNP